MKSLRGQRVLVTGASGFIGRRLCTALQQRGVHVTALMRGTQGGPWQDVLAVDLGCSEFQIPTGISAIFHLAGKAHVQARTQEEIDEYRRIHVQGTTALLHAAQTTNVHTFIYLSSVKAMGEGSARVEDESAACVPRTPYGQSKLEAERLVLESALPCPVILRPTLVYGPGSKGNLAAMMSAVRKGFFPPFSFPQNARSMIHVDDVVQACILAATHTVACKQTYILTDGYDYSTPQILGLIRTVLGKRQGLCIPFWPLDILARIGSALEQAGVSVPLTSTQLDKLTGSARYSNRKICDDLGFIPQYNLQTGIRQMAEYMWMGVC